MPKKKWFVYKNEGVHGASSLARYHSMVARCEASLALLARNGALDDAAPFSLKVVLGGSVLTNTPRANYLTAPTKKTGACEIEVGLDLFEKRGEGAKLIACGANPDSALAFILGHELRHLDDVDRASKCGVTYSETLGMFWGALDPRLPEDARNLLLEAMRIYPAGTYRRTPDQFTLPMPLSAVKASDVAWELRADLEAMHWTREANLWTPALQAAVIAARTNDQSINPPSHYQIGAEWPAFLAVADLEEATTATVERLIDLLVASPDIAPELRAMAAAVNKPLILTPKAPKAGLWDWLVRKRSSP